jgi:hypothetical protein|nr:MAG TPA: hypothetical protein [Caudoviricetes sp.]
MAKITLIAGCSNEIVSNNDSYILPTGRLSWENGEINLEESIPPDRIKLIVSILYNSNTEDVLSGELQIKNDSGDWVTHYPILHNVMDIIRTDYNRAFIFNYSKDNLPNDIYFRYKLNVVENNTNVVKASYITNIISNKRQIF